MAPLKKLRLGRWAVAAVTVALWIALSTFWSWFLISHAFERQMNARLWARARQIAELSREKLAAAPAPASAPAIAGPDLENDLQADMEQAKHSDPNLAYAMIWTDTEGKIIAHSRRDLRNTRPGDLDPQQNFRVNKMTDLSGRLGPVTEVTVPLVVRGKTLAYLSIAYPQQWIEDEFWRTSTGLLWQAAAGTFTGVVILLAALYFAMERLDKRRRIIRQTALARTSLLTERGMLASVLAHEVRSPLTALRFNLHSLRTLIGAGGGGGTGGAGETGGESPDLDRQLELADRCDREIRRLDGMLNDFLQRTQVIGASEYSCASVNAVINEAIEFLRPALERNHIRISVHLDQANPLVPVHPDELRQVILNLATNAQESMPRGKTEGTLAVSTICERPEPAAAPLADEPASPSREASVSILIRDTGAGISPELHERIFEPFFSTKPNGSGLGLALVRRVVSGAGGTVSCESALGEGTTFRILLPQAQPADLRPVRPGSGYAHIRRDEPALDLDSSPEIVIDQQETPRKPPKTQNTDDTALQIPSDTPRAT